MLPVLTRRRIFRHMNPMQFQLWRRFARHHPPLGKTYLTRANALDLRPLQNHPALKSLANHKIMARLSVLNLGLTGVFCHYFGSNLIIHMHLKVLHKSAFTQYESRKQPAE